MATSPVKLPPGFVLEEPPPQGIKLPPGFVLEQEPAEQPGMLRQLGDAAIETIPVVGATLGGIAGLPFGGPVGAIGGAGIGAMAGEAARQLIKPEETATEAAKKIAKQGVIVGAGGELAGMGMGKLFRTMAPALRRSAERTFQKFLGPTKEKMKGASEKVTSEALRRGGEMIGTREGVLARAARKAEAAGEAVESEVDRIAEEATPRIVERSRPVPKALTSGPIRLPAQGGAEKPLSVEAKQIASRIVYFKNPLSGQMEFFAKPALGKGEYQRVLWGPEFTGTKREIAEIRKVYGSTPAKPKEIEEILFAQRGKSGQPQIVPAQAKEEAEYARRVATGEISQSPDVRPLKGLSDYFDIQEKTISTKPFLSALRDYKGQFMPGGKVAIPEAVRQVEAVEKVVRQYGDKVSPQTLIALRRSLDRPVARRGGYAGLPLAEESLVSVRKEVADSIRRALAEEYPSLARVNSEFSFWKNIENILGETVRRTTGQARPLSQQLAGAAGFGGGLGATGMSMEGVGAGALTGSAMLMFTSAVRSGIFKSSSAAFKNTLAQAMARGDGVKTATLLLRLLSGKAIDSGEEPAK